MNHEIHMFLAVGTASGANRYPDGEQHPVLMMVRQPPGSEHDWSTAESVAHQAGWVGVDFTKAGTLPADAGSQKEEPFHSLYVAAVREGHSLLVYDAVVKAAPAKSSPAGSGAPMAADPL